MPDFGIFRGFNEKLFGDKLVAGQLPTQLGLIGSEEVSDVDIDALAFFDRVDTAGGTLSATEKLAIDTLVKQMKLDGIWTKMKAVYPMVGASAAACAQNLKSSSFTGSFTSGWTFASTGVTPNGTSAYMDTGLNMSSNLSQNNSSVMVYSRIDLTSGGVMLGASNAAFNNGCFISPKLTSTLAYFAVFDATNGNTTATITNSLGFLLASRINSTEETYYQNSSKITTFNATSTTPASLNIYVGALNKNGTTSNFNSRETAFASIGDGLTDTEASNFYTAVQAFQTTLSRNV